METNIVENWLRSLNVVQYTQAFLDNGYDDLEVCKQIGADDLDAIGVRRVEHRAEILAAARQLLEHGGTAVYFTLDPEYQRGGAVGGVGAEHYYHGVGHASSHLPGLPGGGSGQHYRQYTGMIPSYLGGGDKENYGHHGYQHQQQYFRVGMSDGSRHAPSLPHCIHPQYELHPWPGSGGTAKRNSSCVNYMDQNDQGVIGSTTAVVSINGSAGGSVVHGDSMENGVGGGRGVGRGTPGGDSPESSGCPTPVWTSPTHRSYPIPTSLPLPPPPPPPPGYCPAGLQGRVGVPLPLPPCRRCQEEEEEDEEEEGGDPPHCDCACGSGSDDCSDVMPSMTSCTNTLVTYPRVQLSNIVRDKLNVDDIALTDCNAMKKVNKI